MRVDLSKHLIHLTRNKDGLTADFVFKKIMNEKKLLGSSFGVRGKHDVICFSEAPVEVLAKLFNAYSKETFRYSPFGVMIPKDWLFAKGARPVIYQPESEYDFLPTELQYRHVRFDEPGGKLDFTFEREWRIPTKELELDPKVCTLIVPHRDWDYRLREEHFEQDRKSASVCGQNPLTRMTSFDWRVLALGDLGAELALD